MLGKTGLRVEVFDREPLVLTWAWVILKWVKQATAPGKPQKKRDPLASTDDITIQTKVLCQEYIYARLKAGSIWPKELEGCARNIKPSDVSLGLQRIGAVLEKTYPHMYRNVAKQTGTSLETTQSIPDMLTTVAEPSELLLGWQSFNHARFRQVMLPSRSAITWGRVVALFSVAAGLAEDCVKQGHPDYVTEVIDVFSRVTRHRLDKWIARQGGWISLLHAFPTQTLETAEPERRKLTVVCAVAGFVTSYLGASHCFDAIGQWYESSREFSTTAILGFFSKLSDADTVHNME